jgi:DNA-binding GntR family transcriptional regulator
MSVTYPAREPSRADTVYEQLKRDIAEFRFLPGDRFTESTICSQQKVSRTPVRQALFRLRQEGVVEVHFRSGWEVKPFDFEKFDHLYDLRILLETTAVQRLCRNGFQHPLKEPENRLDLELLTAQAQIWMVPESERSTDRRQVAVLDEEFHLALVQAIGNPEMLRVHRDVTERIRSVRRLDFTLQDRIQATYKEHSRILTAVLKHDIATATALLLCHIQASQAQVRSITLHQIHQAKRLAAASAWAPPSSMVLDQSST